MFIDKKRLFITLFLLLIILFLFQFIFSKEKMTVPTMSLPVTNKVIVVDAGHGEPDKGAEGPTGITEQQINLAIGLKLQKILEQSGATVILTRSDEKGIYEIDKQGSRKMSDFRKRVEITEESGADLFVSIHLNKFDDAKYWGWQTFYNSKLQDSKRIATNIQESLNEAIQKENTRKPARLDDVYLMKKINIPICIVECGFLSNPEEENLLTKDDYQDKLTWGIYNGIMDYFYQ